MFARPADEWDVDAATRPLGVYYRVNQHSVVDMQAAIHDIGAVYVSATRTTAGTRCCATTNRPAARVARGVAAHRPIK